MAEDSGITAATALPLVRDRARRFVSIALNDTDALMVALSCATMEHASLLELAHDRTVSSEASQNATRLQLPSAEFGALFCGPPAAKPLVLPHRRDRASLQAAAQALQLQDAQPETQALHASIASALQTTLDEAAQKAAWGEARTRRLAALALMRENDADSLDCLRAVLGEVVRSDLRRWEDLREEQRANGLDLMLVSELISAVANSA
tara:strand:- start:3188 stop:3811 length:624 start_codon:yes stop_codon:yes gene_type:complete